jgi:hypothetical protein
MDIIPISQEPNTKLVPTNVQQPPQRASLLGIPPEVRGEVFKHLYCEDRVAISIRWGDSRRPTDTIRIREICTHAWGFKSKFNLLKTCRSLRAEVLPFIEIELKCWVDQSYNDEDRGGKMILPLSKTYLELVKMAQIFHPCAFKLSFDLPFEQPLLLQVADLILSNLTPVSNRQVMNLLAYRTKGSTSDLLSYMSEVRLQVLDGLLYVYNLFKFLTAERLPHELTILWTTTIETSDDFFVSMIRCSYKI